jgi:glutaredoxin 3
VASSPSPAPRIVLYTTHPCGWCRRARQLLAEHGLVYEEVDVRDDDARREWLVATTGGRRTLPQIFVDDRPIGGYQELAALLRSRPPGAAT